MPDLRALSVRQPWAHAIIHLGKNIENRTKRYSHRGLTLIHASAGMTLGEFEKARHFMDAALLGQLPPPSEMQRGGIVGVVEVVDSISASDPRAGSPWWMGPYGLVLRNARPLPFIPCAGTISPMFWTPDKAVLARVEAALQQVA